MKSKLPFYKQLDLLAVYKRASVVPVYRDVHCPGLILQARIRKMNIFKVPKR
jgi:hypothetical protein